MAHIGLLSFIQHSIAALRFQTLNESNTSTTTSRAASSCLPTRSVHIWDESNVACVMPACGCVWLLFARTPDSHSWQLHFDRMRIAHAAAEWWNEVNLGDATVPPASSLRNRINYIILFGRMYCAKRLQPFSGSHNSYCGVLTNNIIQFRAVFSHVLRFAVEPEISFGGMARECASIFPSRLAHRPFRVDKNGANAENKW